jgi:transcriptional regulator with XRE-family HTH domain
MMNDDVKESLGELAMQIFAGRLKAARATRKLTQTELGNMAGITASSIAQFEGNHRAPSLANLKKLARTLDVTADYLLGLSETPVAVQSQDAIIQAVNALSQRDIKLVEGLVEILVRMNNNGV